MLKIQMTFLAVLLSAAFTPPLHAQEVKPCVKYWVVGMSECEPEPVSETIVVKEPTPTIVAPASPPKPALDERIDEFMENYGKPPREFVAFHLEPTLENALAWVRVYNEKLQRNVNITEAWIQAEEIYNSNLKQGVDVTQNLPNFQNGSALMEVPDFGVPIERFKPVVPELEIYKEIQRKQKEEGGKTQQESRIGAYGAGGKAQEQEGIEALAAKYGLSADYGTPPSVLAAMEQLRAAEERKERFALNPTEEEMAQEKKTSNEFTDTFSSDQGNPINTAVEAASDEGHVGYDGKIKIDYYFSAKCPYCAKFEPEFQQMITQYGDKLDVTCVDATPAQRVASNIMGKVDCTWRALSPGEAQQMGIRSTPSLIIRRAPGQPLERIGGYVEIDKIINHLFGGQ